MPPAMVGDRQAQSLPCDFHRQLNCRAWLREFERVLQQVKKRGKQELLIA